MSTICTFRNCGDMGSGVCGGVGEKIMYVWGRNAPKLKLPPGKSVPSVYYKTDFLYAKGTPLPLLDL